MLYILPFLGPIASTIPDFWRMVWEQQTRNIVMVTNPVEGGIVSFLISYILSVIVVFSQFSTQTEQLSIANIFGL